MYLSSLEIKNYKSFFESQKLSFQAGFNVIFGANNAGKTTILEALDWTHAKQVPHKSLQTLPRPDSIWQQPCQIESFYTFEPNELPWFFKSQFAQFPLAEGQWLPEASDLEWPQHHKFQVGFRVQPNQAEACPIGPRGQLAWRALNSSKSGTFLQFQVSPDGALHDVQHSQHGSPFGEVYSGVISRTYRFASERRMHHQSGSESGIQLLPDASNLAHLLNKLQTTNPEAHTEFCNAINSIFPQIKWIQSAPIANQQFELQCWPVPIDTRRADLVVSMEKLGTGVFNAAAILYAAMTTSLPSIIAIEEPNSFLHPKAVRTLVAILANLVIKHQYFITTHSADVLRSVSPATLTYVRLENGASVVRQESGDRLAEVRSGLQEVGIRMTDLHGCDYVLWVEGETEQQSIPLVLRKFFPSEASAIAVLPVASTGVLGKKKVKPEEVARIYQRLSESSSLAPPTVGIILDREGKSTDEIARIEGDSKTLKFLPRKMYEDYLLDAHAIAEVLAKDGADPKPSVNDINMRLSTAASLPDSSKPNSDVLLGTIFSELTNQKHTYRKTLHGPQLTQWLIDNKPEVLRPLADWIGMVIARPEPN